MSTTPGQVVPGLEGVLAFESSIAYIDGLSEPYADATLRREIVDAVSSLETVPVRELAALLARVQVPED